LSDGAADPRAASSEEKYRAGKTITLDELRKRVLGDRRPSTQWSGPNGAEVMKRDPIQFSVPRWLPAALLGVACAFAVVAAVTGGSCGSAAAPEPTTATATTSQANTSSSTKKTSYDGLQDDRVGSIDDRLTRQEKRLDDLINALMRAQQEKRQ
jgi:hypothetical protein